MAYSTFSEWAAARDTEKVCCLEMQAVNISTGATVALYFATDGGVWDGTHYFEPYLKAIPQINHRAQKITGGSSFVSFAEIEFNLARGKTVDPAGTLTWEDLIDDYSFDGQPNTIKVGGPELDYSAWGVVLVGVSGQASHGQGIVTITARSKAATVAELEVPPNVYGNDTFPAWQASTAFSAGYLISPTTDNGHYYECTTAGTSGGGEPSWPTTDGGTVSDGGTVWTCRTIPDATQGQARPLCYGQRSHVSPKLIAEDATNSVCLYQFHDPAISQVQAFDAVYINGAPVTSGFSTSLVGCWVKFNTKPDGPVTLDVKGAQPAGGYVDSPGDIFKQMLIDLGGVATGDIDLGSYASDVPFSAGIYLDSKVALQTAFDSLTNGLLTHWGDTRLGNFVVRKIAPATPVMEFTPVEIKTPEGAESSLDTTPAMVPVWKVSISGDRVQTTNANPDSSISANDAERLKTEYRTREAQDQTIKDIFPSAEAVTVLTHLASLTDCATVAGWHLALYGGRTKIASFRAPLTPLTLNLGDTVSIDSNVPGYSGGREGLIVGMSEDYSTWEISLEVLING